jgi:hypothetical protein
MHQSQESRTSVRFAMHVMGLRELSLSVGDEGYRLPGSPRQVPAHCTPRRGRVAWLR